MNPPMRQELNMRFPIASCHFLLEKQAKTSIVKSNNKISIRSFRKSMKFSNWEDWQQIILYPIFCFSLLLRKLKSSLNVQKSICQGRKSWSKSNGQIDVSRRCLKVSSADKQTPFLPPSYVIQACQKYRHKQAPFLAFMAISGCKCLKKS